MAAQKLFPQLDYTDHDGNTAIHKSGSPTHLLLDIHIHAPPPENVLTEQADSLAVSPATIYQMLSFWSDLIFCHFGGEIFVRMESFYQGKFFIEMCKVSL